MNRHAAPLAVLLLCLALLASGCGRTEPRAPEAAGELADREDRTVYLREGERWTPYMAVSGDYGGNILLLRQEVLEETCAFSPEGSGYYGESLVDDFLNTDFLDRFSREMQAAIADTDLVICRDYPDTEETETIRRKVFLLSGTEVQIDMAILTEEGTPLDFFSGCAHHQAQRDGQPAGWWLRSTYMMDRGLAWHIQPDGTYGGAPVQLDSGVRPALCVSPDLPLVRQEIGGGQEGLTLEPAA